MKSQLCKIGGMHFKQVKLNPSTPFRSLFAGIHGTAFDFVQQQETESFEIAFPVPLSPCSPCQISFPWMTRRQFDRNGPTFLSKSPEQPAKIIFSPVYAA